MALDQSGGHLNPIHWSQHLGPEVEITNNAMPGASNTMIFMQLQDGIAQQKFDGIVLGFTAPFRLEFDSCNTSCHAHRLSQDQKLLDSLYRENIHWEMETIRNTILIENTILLAKKYAPTVFSLNLFDGFVKFQPKYHLLDLKNNTLPLGLHGHREFDPADNDNKNFATFHVMDPKIHKQFALQVKEHLLKFQ